MALSMARDRLALFNVCGAGASVSHHPTDSGKIIGKTVRYVGKAGEAAKVKALVNMVMNINTAGLAEGLGLGGRRARSGDLVKIFSKRCRLRVC